MICENCSSNHDGSYGSGRFCSVKCARGFSTKYNREETNKKVSETLGGKNYTPREKFCLYCGKVLKHHQKKVCSNKCWAEYIYLLNVNSWLLGEYVFKDSMSVPTFIRKYLFKKYDSSCSICGWCEINPLLKIPILEVEHIDGNCMDNSYENVTLLCPNCHTLTPTYRSLNKGNPKRDKRITYGGRSFKS